MIIVKVLLGLVLIIFAIYNIYNTYFRKINFIEDLNSGYNLSFNIITLIIGLFLVFYSFIILIDKYILIRVIEILFSLFLLFYGYDYLNKAIEISKNFDKDEWTRSYNHNNYFIGIGLIGFGLLLLFGKFSIFIAK